MANEKRLIDANGSYTLNATDNTGYSICFYGGTISVFDDFGRCVCELDAEDAPAVDAVEVVHGRWIDRYGGKYANPLYECSACKNSIIPTAVYKIEVDELGHEHIVQALTNYCPNCGAKMDKEN